MTLFGELWFLHLDMNAQFQAFNAEFSRSQVSGE